MIYRILYSLAVVSLLMFFSCSVTRGIPDGEYLLDEVKLETDSNSTNRESLSELIQQQPNKPKLGLKIYNLVDNDSTWFKRLIRKMGEPPVIFSSKLMNQTLAELSIETKNRGYLNSRVHATIDTVGKKISVEYHIHEGIPYRINSYENFMQTDDSTSIFYRPSQNRQQGKPDKRNVSASRRGSAIKTNSLFDMNLLENEMNRISTRLRNSGFYKMTADNLHFEADTTRLENFADLRLTVLDTSLLKTYQIDRVRVLSGYDRFADAFKITDSVTVKDITIYYDNLHFLRPKVISDKILIRPGKTYSQRSAEATYSLFQSLDCVNYTNIEFVEKQNSDTALLDCNIYLSPADNHSLRTGLNGTNKAGDFGLSSEINYSNQNLFNGSELLNIGLTGAYEWVKNDDDDTSNHNYFEFGITPSLTFSTIHLPWVNSWMKNRFNTQTLYGLGLEIQHRPQFTRNFFNFKWQFRWSGRNNIMTQTFTPLDVNYVYMPWVSDSFKRFLNTRSGPVTRYSYEDVFTAGSSYGFIYTNANTGRKSGKLYTVRFNAESSGNTLNAIFSAENRQSKSAARQYNVFGNPYAQYVKGDIDFAETLKIGANSSFALHAGLGVANPYKNSSILPFEKRYYAGGPNNVRGWNTRYLGPGSMPSRDNDDMALHVGDISLILSAEYRYKALEWLEPALFVDGGNIWTIKEYADQPGGQFHWNSFYKEMAVGAGFGLRFDIKFLLFRIDLGKRVYDPSLEENKRFVLPYNSFWENWKFYVAIGYPF